MYVEDEDHDEVLPNIEEPADGAVWRAPARLEQRLHELRRQEEDYEYLRLVAAEGLYRPMPTPAASRTGQPAQLHTTTLADGRRLVPVYTAGVLPRPHRDVVYDFITLAGLDAIWPDGVEILAVDPATPCEQLFLADDEEREIWVELTEDLFRPDDLTDRLDTRRTDAPTDPDLLRGLAGGAHLCYANGDAWNTLNWHGAGYYHQVEELTESWGVSGPDDWQAMQERLLACEVSPWPWDFVLGARNLLVERQGHPRVDPATWRQYVTTSVHRSPDETEDDLAEAKERLSHLVGQVLRYESRFRADRLLSPDGYVKTVAAWDLGRASGMARWGRGARYATETQMHDAVRRAGQSLQAAYRTWGEFSAGYILGRCLHFDDEEFGDWYTSVLAGHRALMSAPESPFATVPLR